MIMSGNSETTVRPRPQAQPIATSPIRRTRPLAPWATWSIIGSVILMIGASLLRASWMPPVLPMPRSGPPWEIAQHVPGKYIVAVIWIAGALGGAGVLAGLGAIRRGERLPLRALVVTGLVTVAVMTVLPSVGSTDALDYAVYGHIAALGHSPYVMTPGQYRALTHIKGVPPGWLDIPSVYGPLATLEQLVAAKLSGTSLAQTVFWLKLVNAFAFGAVAWVADRLLRSDPAARMRAHLLWTVNPLLLWNLIAAGHLDLPAAAIGLFGLLIIDRWVAMPPLWRALAAGACAGVAIDIKANYALFLLAICWALRRDIRHLLIAVGGSLVVLVPSYLLAGWPAIKAPVSRASDVTGYGFYGFYGPFLHHLGFSLVDAGIVAACLLIPVGWLAIARLPAGVAGGEAIRAALALGLTWLLLWPDQFAWYSVIIICVLVFYPATRLDWLAIAWLTALTIADMPGRGLRDTHRYGALPHELQRQFLEHLAPLVMLVTAIALVVMCINGRWQPGARAPVRGPRAGRSPLRGAPVQD
jgi:hypothetical protein